MRRPRLITGVGLILTLTVLGAIASARFAFVQADGAAAVAPALKIREIDISGDNFVVLQNTGGDIAHLSNYWLGYASDSSSGALVPTQQLPDVLLATGQSIIALYGGSTDTCDANYIAKLSFDFAKTGGTFALWRLDNSSAGVLSFVTTDSVRWANPSKTATLPSGVDLDIRKETTPTVLANPVWYSDPSATAHNWQVGDLEGCSLTFTHAEAGGGSTTQTVTWQHTDMSPPSVTLADVLIGGSGKSAPGIPASDKGLLALQLSELLPNTASPQTDAANEFIELYNPNGKSFDLSGFMLQTASATSSAVHTYHIPAGTTIGPGSFKSFTSAQTHLALNNSGGEVWLVDPLGNTVAHSAAYGKAADGMAWVNADGKWQWSAVPTPGATNKVATPIAASSSSKTATVNNKKVTAVASSPGGIVAGASTVAANETPGVTIHPLVLALVVAAALLYGAYEYRHDLAYRIRQLRRHRTSGR